MLGREGGREGGERERERMREQFKTDLNSYMYAVSKHRYNSAMPRMIITCSMSLKS